MKEKSKAIIREKYSLRLKKVLSVYFTRALIIYRM